MTSQCASGSGQFLKNISRYLGVTMAEIGSLSLEADAPEACSSICAVLAESVDKGKAPLQILTHEHSALAGAIGAAIWGAFRARKMESLGVSLEAGAST